MCENLIYGINRSNIVGGVGIPRRKTDLVDLRTVKVGSGKVGLVANKLDTGCNTVAVSDGKFGTLDEFV